jgi:hypothetical protein
VFRRKALSPSSGLKNKLSKKQSTDMEEMNEKYSRRKNKEKERVDTEEK